MTNDLLPDEITIYRVDVPGFGDMLTFTEPLQVKYQSAKYTRANNPAEADLDALKREVLQEYGGNGIVGSACIDDIEWVISYLHSSGHLATGKGGGDKPVIGMIGHVDSNKTALTAAIRMVTEQPAAPTQIDAGELKRALEYLNNPTFDDECEEWGRCWLIVEAAARAHLEKSKGGV